MSLFVIGDLHIHFGSSLKATEQLKGKVWKNHEEIFRKNCEKMIRVRKRIIIVSLGFVDMIMVNPVIIQKSQPYDTEEGCLSLQGVRKTTRFRKIKVRYHDESFKDQTQEFEGYVAQIIQHECDHLEGIII